MVFRSRLRTCPVCHDLFWSMGLAPHLAMHRRKGELPAKEEASECGDDA